MIREKVQELKERHQPSELKMAFFDSIHLVPSSWDELVQESSVYLTTSYLSAIENAMHHQLSFRYILFSKNNQTVAVAAFQLITIDSEALALEQTQKRKIVLGKVLDQIKLNCLINGTLFGSGENGFFYSSAIDAQVAFKALADGTKRLCALEEIRDKVHVIMVKEYFPERVDYSNELIRYKYRNFKMEPNMVLQIKEQWKSMEDYYQSMTSKYRNKAKSGLKKSAQLVVKDLSAQEIKQHLPVLKSLFHAVHDKAEQKLGELDVACFVELKKNLQEQFVLKGYFLDNTLVGFGSIFLNHGNLDSNYVGLNYDFNRSHGIYQRILYDLVQLAIEKQVKRLHFGRTASEIKSNFGAKAVHMECYVRTKNSISNKIIKPLVKQISTPDFIERNPFKE